MIRNNHGGVIYIYKYIYIHLTAATQWCTYVTEVKAWLQTGRFRQCRCSSSVGESNYHRRGLWAFSLCRAFTCTALPHKSIKAPFFFFNYSLQVSRGEWGTCQPTNDILKVFTHHHHPTRFSNVNKVFLSQESKVNCNTYPFTLLTQMRKAWLWAVHKGEARSNNWWNNAIPRELCNRECLVLWVTVIGRPKLGNAAVHNQCMLIKY